jgi:hypothetical protein
MGMMLRFEPTSRMRQLSLAVCICAAVVATGPASAQTSAQNGDAKSDARSDAKSGDNVFSQIGRWFDSLGEQIKDAGKDVGEGVDNFGQEAGSAAKQTAQAAGNAAGAVAGLTETRIVRGHETCAIAANGAPDCRAAANALCKANGMKSGSSLDITAAENCPVRVMTGERAAEPGECKNVTFVSRALCR